MKSNCHKVISGWKCIHFQIIFFQVLSQLKFSSFNKTYNSISCQYDLRTEITGLLKSYDGFVWQKDHKLCHSEFPCEMWATVSVSNDLNLVSISYMTLEDMPFSVCVILCCFCTIHCNFREKCNQLNNKKAAFELPRRQKII